MNARIIVLFALALSASPALGQSNVSRAHSSSWNENCGWMNWHDAGSPPGAQGASFAETYLSGFVWLENAGWVRLGVGSPADGVAYANLDSSDFGVNMDPATGRLSGMAWGENIGWINFDAGNVAGGPDSAARLTLTAPRRLRGYAWGENIGWVSFNDAIHFVGVDACACDFNTDSFLNSQDFFDFLTAFFGASPGADFNTDGSINSQDFFDFLSCFFGGC